MPVSISGTLLHTFFQSLEQPYDPGTDTMPILQMRKLRRGEAKSTVTYWICDGVGTEAASSPEPCAPS